MNDYFNFYKDSVIETNGPELVEEIKSLECDDSVFLTISELQYLEDNLSLDEKKKLRKRIMFLYFKNPTELSYEKYLYYFKKYNLYHLFVKGFSTRRGKYDIDPNCTIYIDPSIMRIYLKKINELIKGLPNYSDTDFDLNVKTICILANRIIEKVFYDVTSGYQNKLKKYDSKYGVPNEIIGIVEEKAVCRGFAGIFRDACRLLLFEVKNITGFNDNLEGHEWNQIRIGKKWFNCDLTWDSICILNKSIPPYLLSNDTEFYETEYMGINNTIAALHREFLYDCDSSRENVDSTIARGLITNNLYIEEEKKKNWLELLKNIIKDKKGEIIR